MKRIQREITASLISRKDQALDTLNTIKYIYESDSSDLLTGGFYDSFMKEVDTQIDEITRTINSATSINCSNGFSKDVSSISDIDDEIFLAIQNGTTKEDIEDYLIELEDSGVIDRDEFKQLKSSAFDEFDRYKETFGSIECSDDDFVIRTPKKLDEAYLNYKGTRVSKYMPKSKQAELRKTKAEYKNEMSRLSKEYKQYIYRCVAEAPQVPDPDNEEAWSAYTRDAKEYKTWCFADGVEDGLFEDTDADYAAFERMWKQAETDMAQPYA